MGKVRDFVRAVDVIVIHINLKGMQDWFSVSENIGKKEV